MNISRLNTKAFWRLTLVLLAISLTGCRNAEDFSKSELALIHGTAEESDIPEGTMRVLTIDAPADCLVLRAPSHDLSDDALLSSDYEKLAELMVATVTHPSQDGVGIAGPQVGLNRRVVAVQRFDKEPVLRAGRLDHPFEVYPNIRIVWASDSLAAGPEGCLSVPDRRGNILRSTEIVIEYADITGLKDADSKSNSAQPAGCTVPIIRDTVSGFTAVIFQHEIDHLEGVLYIDRL
jgi:peptide deformylase